MTVVHQKKTNSISVQPPRLHQSTWQWWSQYYSTLKNTMKEHWWVPDRSTEYSSISFQKKKSERPIALALHRLFFFFFFFSCQLLIISPSKREKERHPRSCCWLLDTCTRVCSRQQPPTSLKSSKLKKKMIKVKVWTSFLFFLPIRCLHQESTIKTTKSPS